MSASPLLLVPFREVRHDQPDDCLHYESVAVRGAEMDWTIPAHRHEGLHQFQFLEKGHVRGTIDGSDFDAEAPVLLMLAPGSVHGFTYTPDTVGHQVTVPTSTLRQLLGGSNLADTELATSCVLPGLEGDGMADSQSLFTQVAQEFRAQSPGRVHALLACATLLAVQFLRRRGEQFRRERGQGARDALLQRYRGLVEQHYREHRPLSFYAEALGVTPDHLSRTCRSATKQSALHILHERLMLEARRLLAYSSMPVTEVALQLGYDDAAYFSKFFNRSVGHTPSEYRALVASGVRGGMAP
ncbi:AraC family transcriptional regulator [Hydrogenophaga sp. BPS33]|uniref:AraC family transcriptional regulator n=1 Tax=Hydrogenophaga sp. BPS33 TaxID=2651974 RepID=UPI00131F6573|nr:helix-turn-helix domain-containing protein [Hydrogenophaga sp. BPS33]QHE84407.1 helix-turn-helix domain-containing protein [Hydrogenophaga sp. BPS33]